MSSEFEFTLTKDIFKHYQLPDEFAQIVDKRLCLTNTKNANLISGIRLPEAKNDYVDLLISTVNMLYRVRKVDDATHEVQYYCIAGLSQIVQSAVFCHIANGKIESLLFYSFSGKIIREWHNGAELYSIHKTRFSVAPTTCAVEFDYANIEHEIPKLHKGHNRTNRRLQIPVKFSEITNNDNPTKIRGNDIIIDNNNDIDVVNSLVKMHDTSNMFDDRFYLMYDRIIDMSFAIASCAECHRNPAVGQFAKCMHVTICVECHKKNIPCTICATLSAA